MNNIAHNAYLQTLVSIFLKQLLPANQLLQLINLPIEQCLLQLKKHNQKNSGLKSIIESLKKSKFKILPAGNMDNLFLSVLLKESQTIIRSLTSAERDFMLHWIRRFELQNISTIIRGKALNYDNKKIRNELGTNCPFSVLSLDELLNRDDITELLSYLETTPFANISRYSRENYDRQRSGRQKGNNKDVFSIETSMHHQYFVGLLKRLHRLDKKEQIFILPLLGKIIDKNNIMALLRYRLKYNLSSSHSYFLHTPGGSEVHSEQLSRISRIEKLSQLKELLPERLSLHIKDYSSLHQIELSLDHNILMYAKSLLTKTRFLLAQAFVYLIIREKQLAQIHAIIKGKLLQLPASEIAFALGYTDDDYVTNKLHNINKKPSKISHLNLNSHEEATV